MDIVCLEKSYSWKVLTIETMQVNRTRSCESILQKGSTVSVAWQMSQESRLDKFDGFDLIFLLTPCTI